MSFNETTRSLFDHASHASFAELRPGEALTLDLYAEEQSYLRFNHSQVRQATAIAQRNLGLTFQGGGRTIRFAIDLTGHVDQNAALIRSLLERARAEAKVLPEDPFQVTMENHGTSDEQYPADYPSELEWIKQIHEIVGDLDFAGLLANGPQIKAVRNSLGLDHWFCSDSFFMDYSIYTINASGENKAVKNLYADRVWRTGHFAEAIANGNKQLELLKRPVHKLSPGEYRVYLAPAALASIVGMFSWGAVSYDAWKKGQSGLQQLIEGDACLSDKFSLQENFRLGLTPRFNSLGELTPTDLPIIQHGQLKNLLVSSRTAKEYGVKSNGADSVSWLGEGLRSPEVSGGDMAEANALQQLETGLYLGNLHYLNWSDMQTARITGMTRYACFWVEKGEIVAPIHDLRFDDSLYRLFGSCLEALTAEPQLFPSTDTYFHRALGGSKVPGAIVDRLNFTF